MNTYLIFKLLSRETVASKTWLDGMMETSTKLLSRACAAHTFQVGKYFIK